MASKFQMAENIRVEEKSMKQAKFFRAKLKEMIKSEKQEKNILQLQSQFEEVNKHIESLET